MTNPEPTFHGYDGATYGTLTADVEALMEAGAYPRTLLGEYAAVAQVIQRRIAEAVDTARNYEPRKSWAAIGAELGVSAQAAQQRFGGHVQRVVEGSDYNAGKAAK